MGDEITVLISDDNIEFGNLLNEKMNQESDIRVVGVARDGVQAVEMISTLLPDIVVLDIIMPNLDGIGVLERIAEMNLPKKPQFLMLSAIGQDIFIQKAIVLGAEYYMVKPFELSVLISRMRQIQREKGVSSFYESGHVANIVTTPDLRGGKPFDVEVEVTNLMHDVGIPPHMVGYQYIREAIILAVNDQKVISSMTRVLYPSIAERFHTTSQKVERAIRNAIEGAWARGNHDTVDALFGYTINYSKGKPTNSEFIAMMADKIRIVMKKGK